MGSMSVQVGPFVSLIEVANGDIDFWTERDWSQKSCYGKSTKGASEEEFQKIPSHISILVSY